MIKLWVQTTEASIYGFEWEWEWDLVPLPVL